MLNCFPLFSPKSNIKISLAELCAGRYSFQAQLCYGPAQGLYSVEVIPAPQVTYVVFLLRAAPLLQQGIKNLGTLVPTHHAQPTSCGLHLSVQPRKTALCLFHKGKPTQLSPVLFPSCALSLSKLPPFPLPAYGFLRAPQSRERCGETRAVAISAAPTAASADNEKPFRLAAIKLLPFHERNPEFFLKPKQKSQPFIRFIII